MKFLLCLLIILILTKLCSAQNWVVIPKTDIEFSNFRSLKNTADTNSRFEYFRKGKRVIGIISGLSKDFYSMFKDTPHAFDIIFVNTRYKTSKSLDTVFGMFDSSILKIEYDEAVIFEGIQTIQNVKSRTFWRMINFTWSSPVFQPCFTDILFIRKKSQQRKSYKLVFKNAYLWSCEI